MGYFLHVAEFKLREHTSLFSRCYVDLAISNEELFSGPAPKRLSIPSFDGVVSIRAGTPAADDFLSVCAGRPKLYEDNLFMLLASRHYSENYCRYFEVEERKLVSLATLDLPAAGKERAKALKCFSQALYRLHDDLWDYKDVLEKVPMVVWVLPYQMALEELSWLVATKHYMFSQTIDRWLDCADRLIPPPAGDPEEDRRRRSLCTHWNRCNLILTLAGIALDVKKAVEGKTPVRGTVKEWFGLGQGELDYLLSNEFTYQYRKEDGGYTFR